jgi:hypothetical protein
VAIHICSHPIVGVPLVELKSAGSWPSDAQSNSGGVL